MTTLVTGAGGFLGQYLVEQLLQRGTEVRALARGDYPQLRQLGAETVRGDIRSGDDVISATAGCEIVFHAAAIAGIGGRWEDYYQINTVGTENVLTACRRNGVAKLIYSSSPSVTFDGRDQCGVDESAPYPTRWLCHYPRSKALAEQSVLRAHGQDGLATCALRPHLIWGPRDRHLVPRLIERARQGQLRRVGDGTNRIDTIYVENAAEAHLQAADALGVDSPVGGRAYFLSQGEPVNCWQWLNRLLELAGLPPVNRAISLRMAWNLGGVLETAYRLMGRHDEPRMTRFLAAQLATSHYFDISAARRDFGYAPRVSTDEGLQRMVAAGEFGRGASGKRKPEA